MSQTKSSSPPLVAGTIIGMAVIFALSLSLGGIYMKNRLNTESPPSGNASIPNKILIDNQNISFFTYPDEQVILLPEDENTVMAGATETAVPIEQTPILVTTSPTAVPPTAVSPTALSTNKITFSRYTVQTGDTLYGIAHDFHWLTTIALMAKYDIASGNIIAGNILNIPIGNAAYCPGNQPYVISDGETAESIASVTGTTVDNIKTINELGDPYTIYVTDVICVP